ncbi:MAG: hypothetical protein H7326_04115 [Bdellovibrionaceae bacterium]|nr:hypothetical protein [Pseudobdellovibrionaceae bacterium]
MTESRNQGVTVDKSVKNLSREDGYQAGDLIEVTLNIQSAGDLRHMAMNDPIPAGANIVADAYGYYSSGQKSYSGYKFYFESLSNGSTIVKYQYQLNNPGVFKLPPTHVISRDGFFYGICVIERQAPADDEDRKKNRRGTEHHKSGGGSVTDRRDFRR